MIVYPCDVYNKIKVGDLVVCDWWNGYYQLSVTQVTTTDIIGVLWDRRLNTHSTHIYSHDNSGPGHWIILSKLIKNYPKAIT